MVDFGKLEDAGLKAGKWDMVFITYGPDLSKAVRITDQSLGSGLQERLPDQQLPSRKSIGSELKRLGWIAHAPDLQLIQIFRCHQCLHG